MRISPLIQIIVFCPLMTFAASTDMSKLVQKLQLRIQEEKITKPILIFDKDEMDSHFFQADAFGQNAQKLQLRMQLIQKYIQEKTNIQINDTEAGNLETYAYQAKDSAIAFPLTNICVVMPADPSSNQRLETERILGLNARQAYGNISYDQIIPKMTFKEMQLFSLYHEIGHCFDQKFLPQLIENQEDPHGTHLSESFAESFALLMYSQDNKKQIYQNRADMRTIYSQVVGRFMATHSENGFGNPLYEYGGLIYHLSPILHATQNYIKTDNVKSFSLNKIAQIATTLVDAHSLDARSFHMIQRVFSDGKEKALEIGKERAREFPDLFSNAYSRLVEFIQKSEVDLARLIYVNLPNQPLKKTLVDLNEKELCSRLIDQKEIIYDQTLDQLRTELSLASEDVLEKQLQRQSFIRKLPEYLSTNCRF